MSKFCLFHDYRRRDLYCQLNPRSPDLPVYMSLTNTPNSIRIMITEELLYEKMPYPLRSGRINPQLSALIPSILEC